MTINNRVHGPSYSTDPTTRALGSTFATSVWSTRSDMSQSDVPLPERTPAHCPLDLARLYPDIFAIEDPADRRTPVSVAVSAWLAGLVRVAARAHL